MTIYTQLFTKKIWFTFGLLSLICVQNINSSTKGCPAIYDVLENELKIEKFIINKVCKTEFYADEQSADGSGEYIKQKIKSICSFDCDEFIYFCPILSKKLHYTLIYNYNDLRWKYNEILYVCKKWDELYYTPETTVLTTTLSPTVLTTTLSPTVLTTQQVINPEKNYSKNGSIAIISVIVIILSIVFSISIYLCRR